jgi:hypothetical protein|tara:strand:+ start:363 stop:650 length:288 start_codon:yes stop_codon:yes gene_type:complete
MALTKETSTIAIEVVGQYKHIQIADDIIVKEDDNEISRTRHRKTLNCGSLSTDGKNDFVATDISGESSDVQGIANTVWTQSVKDAWKAKMIADKV